MTALDELRRKVEARTARKLAKPKETKEKPRSFPIIQTLLDRQQKRIDGILQFAALCKGATLRVPNRKEVPWLV